MFFTAFNIEAVAEASGMHIKEDIVFVTAEEIAAGVVEYYDSTEIEISPDILSADEKEQVLNSLFEAEISDVTYAIRHHLVTCEEVTNFFVERINAYNEEYNCFITLLTENAAERAKELDMRLSEGNIEGALLGVPIVIKDNIDIEGVYTTNGLSWEKSYIADKNADIVDMLLAEGAVILGKTNMSIEAESAKVSYRMTVGMSKNAYNTDLSTGGSSGGSASATSLNMCVAGIGTDTNSSLRIPAALNGCVTLRFTAKKISKNGIVPLHTYRDTPGAITRTVYDVALMADVLTDFENSYTDNLDKDALNGARIGVLKELVEREYSDNENNAAFAAALIELESLGAVLVDVSMPDLFVYSAAAENPAVGEAKAYKAAYYRMLDDYGVEAVVFPTYLSTPLSSEVNNGWLKADSQRWINNARPLASAIGIPEVTVQIGNHSLGAELGMEFAAKENEEQLLLNLAYAYTEHFNHRMVPAGAENIHPAAKAMTMEEIYDAVYDRLSKERMESALAIRRKAEASVIGGVQDVQAEYGEKIANVLSEELFVIPEPKPELSENERTVVALSVSLGVFALLMLIIFLQNRRIT